MLRFEYLLNQLWFRLISIFLLHHLPLLSVFTTSLLLRGRHISYLRLLSVPVQYPQVIIKLAVRWRLLFLWGRDHFFIEAFLGGEGFIEALLLFLFYYDLSFG